jgi:hypothetical protein
MPYQHTEDIDGSREFDPNELDTQMRLVVHRVIAAFATLPNHDETFRSLTNILFRAFLSTHKSIRLLLREATSDPDYASDAMSLVREQVEKIFVITLILDDPQKWIAVYFKDDWRRFYEYEVLLNSEERKDLPGYQSDYRTKIMQAVQANANVSSLEKEFVEHRFNNPGVSLPSHLKDAQVPEFPMPSQVKNSMRDKSAEGFLSRWHKEYKRICGYSHVGLDKLQVTSMHVVKNSIGEAEKKIFIEREIIFPTISTSYVAAASACTEARKYLKEYDSDLSRTGPLLDDLLNFWSTLRQQSLLAKVFWDIRAKHILPPVLGNL